MGSGPPASSDSFDTTLGSTPRASAVVGSPASEPASLSALPPSARYELGSRIGAGGMGEVVNARDIHLGRDVAVKRLRPDRGDDDDLHRFLREARIQGRLDHPAIVPIHDLAVDDAGRPFFAMKRLSGRTLHAVLYGPGEAAISRRARTHMLRCFTDVCLAIEFAHTRGVIHRDLKPGNLVVGDFGEVYVLDWGVARVLADPPEPPGMRPDLAPATPIPSGDGADTMTDPATPTPSVAMTLDRSSDATAGAVLGTPGYIAPEQLRADPAIGPAADIYSLGAILFEILAGEPLHPRGLAALASTTTGVDARPSVRAPGHDIPPELDAICVRATALAAADRFPSARALADAVQGYLDGDRDLVLRRELAKKQLAAARAALADTADTGRRRHAMRAAAAALALDHDSAAATELISQLLLETPAQLPPEVEADLSRAAADHARNHANFSLITAAAYFSFIPMFLWIGVRDWGYLGLAYGLAIFDLVWNQITVRQRSPRPYRAWVNAGTNAVIVGLLGRMFGPWLIAPSLAAVTLAVLASHPHLRRTWVLWLMFLAATLVPWGLEVIGVASPTYRADDHGFTMWSSALDTAPFRGQIGLLVYIVGVLLVAGLLARQIARVYRNNEVRIETQAWQLRQLVPEITTGAANATG